MILHEATILCITIQSLQQIDLPYTHITQVTSLVTATRNYVCNSCLDYITYRTTRNCLNINSNCCSNARRTWPTEHVPEAMSMYNLHLSVPKGS